MGDCVLRWKWRSWCKPLTVIYFALKIFIEIYLIYNVVLFNCETIVHVPFDQSKTVNSDIFTFTEADGGNEESSLSITNTFATQLSQTIDRAVLSKGLEVDENNIR